MCLPKFTGKARTDGRDDRLVAIDRSIWIDARYGIEAMTERTAASKCPSSCSPHAIRRDAITHWLTADVPEQAVCARANVSPDVIDQQYDRRTEREKMEQRRQYLTAFEP